MDKSALVQLMKVMAGNIKVAFFNNCFSATQAESVVQYVDAAIGMDDAIGDDAARTFAAQFYSAIGFSKSVQSAFDQAKLALTLAGIPEEQTPQLHVKDGVDANELILVKPVT
jgi:hypothetical protein